MQLHRIMYKSLLKCNDWFEIRVNSPENDVFTHLSLACSSAALHVIDFISKNNRLEMQQYKLGLPT